QFARVTVRLRRPAPANLVVTFNREPVNLREPGARRVYSGTLVVTATSPETEPWTQTFRLERGTEAEIEVPLAAAARVVSKRQSHQLIALSLSSAGAAAIATGVVFGAVSYADWRSAANACGGNTDHCKGSGFASAQRDLDAARRAARISSWT